LEAFLADLDIEYDESPSQEPSRDNAEMTSIGPSGTPSDVNKGLGDFNLPL
jgi:hypothetical protein